MISDEIAFGHNLTERLTGTTHANGEDYWILAHEWKNDKFLSYLLGTNGLDTIPVVSHTGAAHSAAYGTCLTNRNRQGEMKISYAGDHLAICSSNSVCGNDTLQPSIVQLFNFNDSNGAVTYWMTLPDHSQTYGLEFSQDGSKLYVPGTDPPERYVDQYDLGAGDTIDVVLSRTRIFTLPYSGQPDNVPPGPLELAPNGKIYVNYSGFSLDAINNPDLAGTACDYEENSVTLPNTHSYFGHTNQIKRYHDSWFEEQHTGFEGQPAVEHFSIWPNPTASSVWLSIPANLASPRVRIHDNSGRLLREVSGQVALSNPIDVSGLAIGLYTVRLFDGNAAVAQARLVVH